MKSQYLLLFAIQAVAGTPETLTGANVIETVDGIDVGEYEGDFVTREVDGVVASPGEEINAKPYQTVPFKVDGAGCGSSANAVVYGPILEACGFVRTADATPGSESETFVLDNNVTSPVLTLARYVGDKKINVIPDARGNVEFSFDKFVGMSFNFMGGYQRPIEGAFPSGLVYDNYAEPIPVNADNTGLCKLDGVDIVMHNLSIKTGEGVNFINVPGQKEARHGKLFGTGSITLLAADISDKDWFAVAESHNGVVKVPFEFEHGTVQYNKMNFKSLEVQLTKPKATSIDGDEAYTFDMKFFDLALKIS